MVGKVHMKDPLYKCAKDYAKSIGLSYSAFMRKCAVAELSRRNKLTKKGNKIISVTINDI